ncbi:hypothetical protein BDW02DRAFT_646189 [Decorospora gaudefroyi]|uniref:Major facilitator superfamily (MFS) profile domain-containing protein n=1 Tax=Decorospora gaudefroyi TaxID=184978 RepID=A0A6A5KJT0_9PLEO|nr:hypothetical protein BDW02DRAFT_646189 [Decorospora gaudefroyi]
MTVLLTSPRGSIEEGEAFLSPTELADHPLPQPNKKPWVLLVGLICVMVTVIDVGAFLAEPPQTRIFEANLCLRYYREHDPSAILGDGSIPEKLCKVDVVQQELASIFGWQALFDALPGILLAVPYGTMADRVGRKWVFVACLVGLQLNFAWVLLICYLQTLPLQLTWFSSAFFVIGGGPIVAMAIGLTMISDIAPPDKRTTIFLYLTACVLVAEMIAPIMAARLMENGEWLPLLLALAIQMGGALLAVLVPETLHLRDLPEPKDVDSQSIELRPMGSDFSLKSQLHNFKAAVHFLRSDWTLAMVVFTFLANRLGRQAISLLVRYASKRYDWEIKKAAYLLSFRAATNLVAVTVVIPLTNFVLLKKCRFPAHWADLYIARGSIALTTIAFLVMGIAAHPALLVIGLLVYNMGTGYNAAMRSISIHVVGGQSSPDVGRLMSTIAIAESVGSMIGGPLLNTLFQWGIGLGGAWVGLPFLSSVLVLAVMTAVTFIIDVNSKEVVYDEVPSDDGDLLDEERSDSGTQRKSDGVSDGRRIGDAGYLLPSKAMGCDCPQSTRQARQAHFHLCYHPSYPVNTMLGRANSDAATRLRRSKSASTVHKRPSSTTEPLDLDAIKQQALAAATAAFARAQAQDAVDREAKRSAEVSRSKSNASRKSLTSQGSHFPPRGSSFRSLQPQKAEPGKPAHRLSQASTANSDEDTEQFPPFYPTPSIDRPLLAPRQLSTRPSVTFNDNARPGSQPKPPRQSASSSAASQQIRKARSMYYASSVQTGSPIARPPAKYLTTPYAASLSPASEPSLVHLQARTLRPSPLAGARMSVTVGPDVTLDKARDEYLQGFQQKAVKHKPSIFLAPFKKRQDKGKDQGKRTLSVHDSLSTVSQQAPDESITDVTLDDFLPQPEIKEKRSFSGSLKSKFKKVFRRTSAKSTNLPVQQIEASRDYFHSLDQSPPSVEDAYAIPSPDQETLQRVRGRNPSLEGARPVLVVSGSRSSSNGSSRSNRSLHSEANAPHASASRVTSWGTSSTSDTLTQRAIKRMTVIHESKDSIGNEGDRVASLKAPKRKSLNLAPLASFRDPMPMESLTEESLTPVDPKRVFSALMREIGTSKSAQAPSDPPDRTPGGESDVFESSTTKLHSQARGINSSGSRSFRSSIDIDQRPPSRRPASAAAQSAQSKTSTIRSLGRAIRSTIRTVTPAQQLSSPPSDGTSSVRGAVRVPRGNESTHPSPPASESEDSQHDGGTAAREYTKEVYTPSTSQIEKRVERAKGRWKTPLEEAELFHFPRETNRTSDLANFSRHTASYKSAKPNVEHEERLPHVQAASKQHTHETQLSPKVSTSPVVQATQTPSSLSIYSRNTDGVSIPPNDSVMSFGDRNELEASHNSGSAVILTSQSVRSYVVGTPSPKRPGSTRTSRDWKAWLSHEISGMELTSQEDLRIHQQYATPSGKHRHDSIRTSHTEHEDTTVVLREACDITPPQPDVEPPMTTDASQVAEDSKAQGESVNKSETGASAAMPVIKPHTSAKTPSQGVVPSPTPATQVTEDSQSRLSPPVSSTPVWNKPRPLSTPKAHTSSRKSLVETPRSSQMNERFPFLDTGRRSSSNSVTSSRHSKSPNDSVTSLKSVRTRSSMPVSKVHSSVSAPMASETPQRIPATALKRSDAQLRRKENVTPSSVCEKTKFDAPPLSLSIRPRSQQPLSSSALNCSTSNAGQSISNEHEIDQAKHRSSPATTPQRPRIRATIRPISPEKLARRPRSAFDLRSAKGYGRQNVHVVNTTSALVSSDQREPTLNLKPSLRSPALNTELGTDAVERVIDDVIDGERSERVTPGQRMADQFLRERKSTTALESSVGKSRGGLKLVREDTPAFL